MEQSMKNMEKLIKGYIGTLQSELVKLLIIDIYSSISLQFCVFKRAANILSEK